MPIQSQQSARIAIVEDSPLQAELLKRVLSEKGYAVEVARDGAEGLELVRRIKPDLVVSDVVMPEMDGYDLCRAIKRDRALSGIPVLLLTSLDIVDSGAKLLQQARERGDSEFVAEMEVLQRTVRGLRDRIDELQRQLGGGAS